MYRIALDYTPAYEQTGGIGRYVRELANALALVDTSNEYRLFVAGASREKLPTLPGDNFSWMPTSITPRWLHRFWHRARIPLPVELLTGPVDLFHATDFVLPPTRPATLTLLTVHDLSFVRVPSAASPPLRKYLDTVVPRSVKAADHILADSLATKADLIELYETREGKVTVLYSGVDERFQPVTDTQTIDATKDRYGLGGTSYFLSVGTIQPRKNYSRVIEALSAIRTAGHDLHYVIAGGAGWLEDEMRRTIERTGMTEFVHMPGFVEDHDLPALYSGARALVMASLYEGFGLPILEAMSCGTPVITSNLSSLPEVAGDAAMLVDPYSTDAIRDAIFEIEHDFATRKRLIDSGYEQAKRFSWRNSATQLKSIYDEMLKG